MIKLQPELMTLVREGKKKATTRLGIKEWTLGSNTLVNSQDPSDKIEIIVTGLELATKQYVATSQRIACLENYEHPSELIQKLEEIYGSLDEDEDFTVAHFKVADTKIEHVGG